MDFNILIEYRVIFSQMVKNAFQMMAKGDVTFRDISSHKMSKGKIKYIRDVKKVE